MEARDRKEKCIYDLHYAVTCAALPKTILLFLVFFSANLLLQDAIERIHVGKKYGDIHRGVFLIRGENVVLLGEFVSSERLDLFYWLFIYISYHKIKLSV